MVTQITSPSAGFTGTGATGLQFTDGVAFTSSPSDVAFYRAHGYGIGNNPPTVQDSRTIEHVLIGTPIDEGWKRVVDGQVQVKDCIGYSSNGRPIYGWVPEATQLGAPARDAAVNPQPSDYLAPINAGKADPHGPDVRSQTLETPRSN